jgi:hypothetical protein
MRNAKRLLAVKRLRRIEPGGGPGWLTDYPRLVGDGRPALTPQIAEGDREMVTKHGGRWGMGN